MTPSSLVVHKPAPLRNVAAFAGLVKRVTTRSPDLPGMACFYGRSGLGKTKAAVFGAHVSRATYVEVGQFTTARHLLRSILIELGVQRHGGSVPDMIEQAVERLAADPSRPLIVDEAHWIASKRFVDVLRELHDKSLAPVIMIGEEMLPKALETFERVHNRILEWVAAEPVDLDDVRQLARSYCPDLKFGDDLLKTLVDRTGGNTRRVVVNLARLQEEARRGARSTLALADIDPGLITGATAPMPRRVA